MVTKRNYADMSICGAKSAVCCTREFPSARGLHAVVYLANIRSLSRGTYTSSVVGPGPMNGCADHAGILTPTIYILKWQVTTKSHRALGFVPRLPKITKPQAKMADHALFSLN